MSNSLPSNSSPTSEFPEQLPCLWDRIADALEVIGNALTRSATIQERQYDARHPNLGPRKPASVFLAKYPRPDDEEKKPIEIEDEVEIDSKTGKAVVKPGTKFGEKQEVRSAAKARSKER